MHQITSNEHKIRIISQLQWNCGHSSFGSFALYTKQIRLSISIHENRKMDSLSRKNDFVYSFKFGFECKVVAMKFREILLNLVGTIFCSAVDPDQSGAIATALKLFLHGFGKTGRLNIITCLDSRSIPSTDESPAFLFHFR